MTADDERWMAAAIEAAQRCPEGVPRVGAVIVRNGELLGEGHRERQHAEHAAIDAAVTAGRDVRGATVFTTLEPCAILTGGRTPCAERLIEAQIAEVFIGTYDRNPAIYRKGWKALVHAGISARDFAAALRSEAAALNSTFDGYFTEGTGMTGGAKFDLTQNGGKFVIFTDGDRSDAITTGWGERGATSVYANAGVPGIVALARYATDSGQIDDPDALDYESHFAAAEVGDIVVFRSASLHALVKVEAVALGALRGETGVTVTIKWRLRRRPPSVD